MEGELFPDGKGIFFPCLPVTGVGIATVDNDGPEPGAPNPPAADPYSGSLDLVGRENPGGHAVGIGDNQGKVGVAILLDSGDKARCPKTQGIGNPAFAFLLRHTLPSSCPSLGGQHPRCTTRAFLPLQQTFPDSSGAGSVPGFYRADWRQGPI